MEQEIFRVHDVSAPEGRRLKALIALRGLRVEDVAAAAGMGRPTLYRVLAGTRDLTHEERARLLEVLDEDHAANGTSAATASDGSNQN